MAALPVIQKDSVLSAIDAAFEAATDTAPRPHLGASVIGNECERSTWYSFRWVITENLFEPRILRLFNRGNREELHFEHLLKIAGFDVQTHDSTGKQFHFKEASLSGHFSGSLDGIVHGIPEAPSTWHLLEFKTHSEKSFNDLCKKGVQTSKPNHYDQMQTYMRWAGLERALYMAVNKNDDSLYAERVAYDKDHAERLIEKAKRVITAAEPLPKLTEDPSFFKCKFCDFKGLCHQNQLPSVTCRTCLHSTPVIDDTTDAKWHCAKYDAVIPLEESRKAMDCHRYIPALIPYGAVIDVTDTGDVQYETTDNTHRPFTNGETQPAYLSTELRAANPAHLGTGAMEALKKPLMDGLSANELTGEEFEDDIPF